MLFSFKNFDGDEGLFITLDDVKKLLGWDGSSEMKITVTGSVTEELTGIIFNETASVDVKQTNIKVDALYKPNTIKPGLSYTAYVSDTGLKRYLACEILAKHAETFTFTELFSCKMMLTWCGCVAEQLTVVTATQVRRMKFVWASADGLSLKYIVFNISNRLNIYDAKHSTRPRRLSTKAYQAYDVVAGVQWIKEQLRPIYLYFL